MNFVQFGSDNAGAPGGYAYMTAIRSGSRDPRAFYLMRAPVAGLRTRPPTSTWPGAGPGAGTRPRPGPCSPTRAA